MRETQHLPSDGLPRAGDPAAAERGLARWSRLPDPLAGVDPARLPFEPEPLLAAVFGNSPFLGEALLAEPDILRALLQDGPDATFAAVMAGVAAEPEARRARVMALLRRSRRRLALLTALADIAGLWSLEQVTGGAHPLRRPRGRARAARSRCARPPSAARSRRRAGPQPAPAAS